MKAQRSYKFEQDSDNIFRRMSQSLSGYVRRRQYNLFWKLFNVRPRDKILDVGASPDNSLKYINFFEEAYPYKKRLYIASVEDCTEVVKSYGLAGFVMVEPNKKLPFKNKAFDYVVSWATLEHVGSKTNQKAFINELSRVGKHVFITTPDRYSIYEPDTALFFLHWLPWRVYRKLLSILGKTYWKREENLNSVSVSDVAGMIKGTPLRIKEFKIFNILRSHIIIFN